MNKLVFLGTSGSVPTKDSGLPSVSLKYRDQLLLFDCGEGTQRQMMKYGVGYGSVNAIFISHLHLDHYVGLLGYLHTLNLNKRTTELHVFGPPKLDEFIPKMPFITFHPLTRAKKNIYSTKQFTIDCVSLNHSVKPALGFIFNEIDKVKFNEKLAKSKGLKGPLFTEIQNKGKLKINGKLIKLNDVSYIEKGIKLSYITDTLPSDKIIEQVKGSTIMICDSMFSKLDVEHANEKKHCTAEQSAMMAKKAGVNKLILYHISSRYKDRSLLEAEAKKIFKNTICAKDGLVIEL